MGHGFFDPDMPWWGVVGFVAVMAVYLRWICSGVRKEGEALAKELDRKGLGWMKHWID